MGIRSFAAGSIVLTCLFVACGESGNADEGTGGANGTGSSSASGGSPSDGVGGQTTGGASTGGASAGDGGNDNLAGTGGESSGTTGCGMVAPTGVQELTFDVDGQARTYVLSVPEDYDGSTALPLVFAWHGLGGSGSLARLYFGVEQEANGAAIFVYPDGLPVASQGDANGWDLAEAGIDVALFDQLLEALEEGYCIDPDRVFSIGHSFGGYMTNRLGCSRADVLRAVGPVAGGSAFGGGGDPCGAAIAAFVTHGTQDEVVAVEQGIGARDNYLTRSECGAATTPTNPEPCVSYEGCAEGAPVVWCEHATAAANAHDWPDFAAEGLWNFLSTLP